MRDRLSVKVVWIASHDKVDGSGGTGTTYSSVMVRDLMVKFPSLSNSDSMFEGGPENYIAEPIPSYPHLVAGGAKLRLKNFPPLTTSSSPSCVMPMRDSLVKLKKARAQDENRPKACLFDRDSKRRWSRHCISLRKLAVTEGL